MRTILATLHNAKDGKLLTDVRFWCPECSDEIHDIDDNLNRESGSIVVCHKCGILIHIPHIQHFMDAINIVYNGVDQHYITTSSDESTHVVLKDGYEATIYRKGNVIELFKPTALTWVVRILLFIVVIGVIIYLFM